MSVFSDQACPIKPLVTLVAQNAHLEGDVSECALFQIKAGVKRNAPPGSSELVMSADLFNAEVLV